MLTCDFNVKLHTVQLDCSYKRSIRTLLCTFLIAPLVLTPASAFSSPSSNEQAPANLPLVEELIRFNDIPWGTAFLDKNTLLVSLKRGKLAKVDLKSRKAQFIEGLPSIINIGQGGLLDVAVYKEENALTEATSPWVYLTYSTTTPKSLTTALGRAKLNKDQLVNWETLFVADTGSDSTVHFGSRIAFDNDGHVYISVGDRGIRNNAQNLSSHAGSTIRLKLDGSVPKDNPFYHSENAKAEIWSYGHRNPQGLFYDRTTQRLWSNEHGPRGGDEINVIKKGGNYGWPTVSYGKEYWSLKSVGEGTWKEGVLDAKKEFTPSIAPSDLIVYRGEMFSEWNGDVISTALALRHINRLKFDSQDNVAEEKRYLRDLNERFRSIIQAPDSSLIVTTDSGKLLRLTR
ncbi:PQQ-dependent sugar dehydrogenase [Marinomonas balearica]|uniref:Glucose/arabinose dehydrogenase n=1 Tax=Marinomonas balearica TaxID=491947 RepID=A0A4R6MEA0_9GAMM|nr:PQQ-dependent sugar dehydrogenase [Marinomonas balearica]TDO99914.1 glucose/arabinose dehydrogenase [Marinomonas balearica]